MEKYEYDHVIQRIQFAKSFSKSWHDNIIRWRRLYNFDHYDIQPKSGESQFADPTYTNTVDLAVAILLANAMNWKAKSWKSIQTIETSSLVEKFLTGTLEINSDRNEYHIIYEVLLHFIRDGGAVLYTVWDEIIAASNSSMQTIIDADGNEKQAIVYEQNPLRVQVIDPLSIYLVPGGRKRWGSIMRIEEKSVFDVFTEFGFILPEDRHLTTMTEQIISKGELIDYWDLVVEDGKEVVRNCILYKGQPIRDLQVMPQYSAIPYTIAFYKPTGRSDSQDWHSILTPLEHPVSHLEKSINRRQRQIDVFSSLPLVAKTESGRQISIDPGLGKIVQLGMNEDFGFPLWQGNPPDVREQIDFLRSRVQQSGFSDIFYGSGASAISGYAISQLGDQNRIRLEQPVTHLESFWGWWAKKAIDLTLNYAQDDFILVYGTARESIFFEALPVALMSGHHVVCEIIPEFPNEQVRKHALANQVRGLLSDARIMQEYLGVQQPDEEVNMKIMEMTMNHPLLIQFTIANKLKELAEQGNEAAMATLQALMNRQNTNAQQTNAPNPPQALGIPNRAPKPYGQSVQGAINEFANSAPNMEGNIVDEELV